MPSSTTFNLKDRLQELQTKVIESGNARVLVFRAYNKELKDAKKENREPKMKGAIYPSPYLNPDTSQLEWRYHILTYEKDLKTQLEYLKNLSRKIERSIDELNNERWHELMHSPESEQRIFQFWKDEAEEMGVMLDSEVESEIAAFPS